MNDAGPSPVSLSVIGCGYLGTIHAASMASLGHDVVGLDVDAAKVAELTAGRSPIFEPGLATCSPTVRRRATCGSLRPRRGPGRRRPLRLRRYAAAPRRECR